ncbi:hypothetical protein NKH18_17430 [Streptomyces sp. M10(2022)]
MARVEEDVAASSLLLEAATLRHDTAATALAGRRALLDGLRAVAQDAAAEYHRVRAATDQLTRWHQEAATPEGRTRLGNRAEPRPSPTTRRSPRSAAGRAGSGRPADLHQDRHGPEDRAHLARPGHVHPARCPEGRGRLRSRPPGRPEQVRAPVAHRPGYRHQRPVHGGGSPPHCSRPDSPTRRTPTCSTW